MGARVLLVAWKGSTATAWVESLTAGGYTVLLEDTTGERAWRTAKERGIDVVIIDGQKKPSHGRQTGHALRDTAKTRSIPIIWTNLDSEDSTSVQAEVKPDVTLMAPTDAVSALAALQTLGETYVFQNGALYDGLATDMLVDGHGMDHGGMEHGHGTEHLIEHRPSLTIVEETPAVVEVVAELPLPAPAPETVVAPEEPEPAPIAFVEVAVVTEEAPARKPVKKAAPAKVSKKSTQKKTAAKKSTAKKTPAKKAAPKKAAGKSGGPRTAAKKASGKSGRKATSPRR